MLDVRTWLLWATTCLVLSSVSRNPLYVTVIFLIVTLTNVTVVRGTDGRRLPSPLRIARILIPFAILFNGLTSHTGETVLLVVPAALPLVGGAVTAEGLFYGLLNGMILTYLYAAFATFHEAATTHELIRLFPASFSEAGVVVSIALTFVPQTMRSLKRIREAQEVRGHRVRRLSDWLPIVVPLFVNGLERSMGLAEAMVARGYGSVERRGQPLKLRLLLVGGLVAVLGGWMLWGFLRQQRVLAGIVMLVGIAAMAFVVWSAGRGNERTQYRVRRWGRDDALAAAGCLLVLAMVAVPIPYVGRDTLYYSPYPALAWPPFDPALGIGLLALVVPALVRMRVPDTAQASRVDS